MEQQTQQHEQVTIRPIQKDDHDDVRHIYKQSLNENQEGFIQNQTFHGDIIDQAKGFCETGGCFCVAAKNCGAICGFAAIKQTRPACYELCKLHVKKSEQRKGFGTALSKHMMNCARKKGASEVELHVTASQEKAISVYQNLGFEQTLRKTYQAMDGDIERDFDTIHMSFAITQ